MNKIDPRLILSNTNFYNSLRLTPFKLTIIYQHNRILIYVNNLQNNSFVCTYSLNLKYNLLYTKCKVNISKDGVFFNEEIIDLNTFINNKTTMFKIKKK